MNLEEYAKYDAVALGQLVRGGEITAPELYDLALKAAKIVNPHLNAIVEIFDQPTVSARCQDNGIFTGVPCFKKDLGAAISGRGMACGSRLTAGITMPMNDHFVDRMLQAGLQILGRTTCSEFGGSITTETVAHGLTRNPWNIEFSAGGSSGGSAALVAAGVVPLAHTNDGGGSTRLPASMCGNVGLKASRGLVSMAPSSNELISPLTSDLCNSRSVRDTAAFLDAVAHGSTSEVVYKGARKDFFYLEGLLQSAPKKYRIAFSTDPWGTVPMHGEVKGELERVVALLQDMGHTVEEATPAIVTNGRYWTHFKKVMCCFVSMQVDLWARLLGVTPSLENIEPMTLKMYEAGSTLSAREYMQAWGYFQQVSLQFSAFLQQYDLLLLPTISQPTPKLGTDLAVASAMDLEAWVNLTRQYVPHLPIANVLGIPAISVPVASFSNGMPLGMQFYGAMGAEVQLLDIAHQLEIAHPWSHKRPDMSGYTSVS